MDASLPPIVSIPDPPQPSRAPRPRANINTVMTNGNAPRKGSVAAGSPISIDSYDLEIDPLPFADVLPEVVVRTKRLVLFFDGTGNKFKGSATDTNIIKIYQMLDKHDSQMYLYYQPGIGTYVAADHDFAPGPFSRIKRFVARSIDQAIGTTFDHHVIAGYSFIMRYYSPGDKIYVFGFSRGAYTARFLAQMVQHVGLLSRGNEEMIPFAYKSFAKWERFRKLRTKKAELMHNHMEHFKETFCRPGVRVYIMGLFDTVNSVGRFELPLLRKSFPENQIPAADHIRHAVSIDERRAKFKPALYAQTEGWHRDDYDVQEVWFAGNHADIGGGWAPEAGRPMISDVPLGWMLEELLAIEDKLVGRTGIDRLSWKMDQVDALMAKNKDLDEHAHIHDALKFNRGWGRLATLSWWLIEIAPVFTRLELEHGRWVPRHWPPNIGFTRDIPDNALFHHSVHHREREGKYKPKNDGYVNCVKDKSEHENVDCPKCSHKDETSKDRAIL